MKKKMKLRPWVKITIAVICLALLFFIGKAIYGLIADANYNYFAQSEYSEDCDNQLNPDIEETVTDFLNQFYRAESKLPGPFPYWEYDQEQIDSYIPDMTKFFKDPESTEAQLWQTSLRYVITARSLSPVELSLNDVSFSLTYLKVEQDETSCNISFTESAQFKFAFLGDTVSESYNMPCEMSLENVDGEWKITKYYREDDFSLGVSGLYEMTGSIDKTFKKAMNMYIKNLKSREKALESFHKGLVSFDKTFDVPYDREKALEYASKYVKKRNSQQWGVYDDFGGNCQNFGSQVLYAGGIPMDLVGPDIWKYYGDAVDNSSAQTGRSYSWTGAPVFNVYAANNEGFGLVATVDANIYSAEAGDILQVGPRKGEISHTNVVIGTVSQDDQVIDVLFNSNTNNRINWPLSASLSSNYSLIKVHGYNQ